MNHLNEDTIMEVAADIINSGKLEEYDTADQMEIIELELMQELHFHMYLKMSDHF